jgi:hypothetical protein
MMNPNKLTFKKSNWLVRCVIAKVYSSALLSSPCKTGITKALFHRVVMRTNYVTHLRIPNT